MHASPRYRIARTAQEPGVICIGNGPGKAAMTKGHGGMMRTS